MPICQTARAIDLLKKVQQSLIEKSAYEYESGDIDAFREAILELESLTACEESTKEANA